MRLTRDNWFLVVPTVFLGIAATITLYRLHAAGDVRRAIEIVSGYEAAGRPPLGEFLAARGPISCAAEVVSSFYGTMDVTCSVGRLEPSGYRWRVDLLQRAFAPADDVTRQLMADYEPSLYWLPEKPDRGPAPAGHDGLGGRGSPPAGDAPDDRPAAGGGPALPAPEGRSR